MSDSRIALITADLVSALHGKSLTYNGTSHTITAEQERITRNINGRFPFIEVQGPYVEVLDRSSRSVHVNLHYVIDFIENSIDDTDTSTTPISEVMKNTLSDLIKLIIGDPTVSTALYTRGGNAMKTNYMDFGYYFDEPTGAPEFHLFIMIEVETMLSQFDPSVGG